MRATVIYGAGDVRVETVPDPVLQRPTDALVRVVRACICGSDLWPYGSMPDSHGRVEPGRVFDCAVGLDGVPDGYRAMADRKALKVLITP